MVDGRGFSAPRGGCVVTGLLASVATLDEMELARLGGADVVDLKDPSRGALGAWAPDKLKQAAALWNQWWDPRPKLSATIGDQPMEPDAVRAGVEAVAKAGVPMIKLGMFPGGDALGCFDALRPVAGHAQLIAVFFADGKPDFDLLPELAAAGFTGAMVDTADKASGSLRRHLDDHAVGRFVARAHALGMIAGLAGSLRLEDIAPLAAHSPDYLGFRGALCAGARTGRMTEAALERVRSAIDSHRLSDSHDFTG